jgi:hypothetical protein
MLDSGRPAMAAQILGHAFEREPSRGLREVLGSAQLAAGQLIGAFCTFGAMCAVAPRDDFAHYGWGLAHARLGDLAAARREFATAVRLRPEEPRYQRARDLLAGEPGKDDIDVLPLGDRPAGPPRPRSHEAQRSPVSRAPE